MLQGLLWMQNLNYLIPFIQWRKWEFHLCIYKIKKIRLWLIFVFGFPAEIQGIINCTPSQFGKIWRVRQLWSDLRSERTETIEQENLWVAEGPDFYLKWAQQKLSTNSFWLQGYSSKHLLSLTMRQARCWALRTQGRPTESPLSEAVLCDRKVQGATESRHCRHQPRVQAWTRASGGKVLCPNTLRSSASELLLSLLFLLFLFLFFLW